MTYRRSVRAWILLVALAASQAAPAAGASGGKIRLRVDQTPHLARIGGDAVLVYEVHLTNASEAAVRIEHMTVVDPSDGVAIASLDASDLASVLRTEEVAAPLAGSNLLPGKRAVAYLWTKVDPKRAAMAAVLTKVRISEREKRAEVGILAAVARDRSCAWGPPLAGGPWIAVYDPTLDRGHRRVFYTEDGKARIPGRYAIDWFKVDAAGRMFAGERRDPKAWFGYGAEVLAVADGVVVAAVDGRPDRSFGPSAGAHDPAQGSGNHIVLDVGNGRFAFYEHLKPGSLRIRQGESVRKGAVMAALGNSGDTAGPHLHFHVADAEATLGAEGLPFAFERFDVLGTYASIGQAFAGLPWEHSAVETAGCEMPPANAVVKFRAP